VIAGTGRRIIRGWAATAECVIMARASEADLGRAARTVMRMRWVRARAAGREMDQGVDQEPASDRLAGGAEAVLCVAAAEAGAKPCSRCAKPASS
jgi:hypothetical protein